ncbi:MAG: aminotransferase class IV [Halofilum sp. (in: g-proteobacteria)]|nr:aminotransferase class IV [Halofilum sp. (in: g-proteobacteria)]
MVTPALDDCGVRGVMRAAALALAADAGIDAEVRDVDPAELDDADEVFVTSALRGVAAVDRIGEQRFPAPGPITERLIAAHSRLAGMP